MKKLLLLGSAAMLFAVAPAIAQTSTTTPSRTSNGASSAERSTDTRLIEHVARGGMAEVKLGQLAEQKASSPEVKALAQRIVTDHSKANQQLKQIAQREGVQPPTSIGKAQAAKQQELEKLSGGAFDRAYVKDMIADHQKDIKYLQQQGAKVQDPTLKSFVQQTTPVLQQHLQMAEQASNQLGTSGSSQPKSSTPRSR